MTLGARVESPVDFAQAVAGDVGVDLRRADIRVAEQFLDDAQVSAMLEQVRGETVTQHVGRDVARNARALHASFDAQPECYRGEGGSMLSSSRAGQEYVRR